MPTTSRYILELNGAPSVSSTNNSVVNIPGIAGAGSNVAIDLDTLGTTVVSNTESCIFNVYGDSNTGSVISGSQSQANLHVCFSNDIVNGNDYLGYVLNSNNLSSSLYIASNSVYNAGGGINGGTGYCAITIPGYSCNSIDFSIPIGNTGGRADLLDSSSNPITPTSGSTTITDTTTATQGITFTCGTDSSINYSYNNFDVTLQNNCTNHGKSFLVFTPQGSATGTQSLGNSVNTDGSINLAFNITDIQNQNGDFYIEPVCDVDGSGRPVLMTVCDNTILS